MLTLPSSGPVDISSLVFFSRLQKF